MMGPRRRATIAIRRYLPWSRFIFTVIVLVAREAAAVEAIDVSGYFQSEAECGESLVLYMVYVCTFGSLSLYKYHMSLVVNLAGISRGNTEPLLQPGVKNC